MPIYVPVGIFVTYLIPIRKKVSRKLGHEVLTCNEDVLPQAHECLSEWNSRQTDTTPVLSGAAEGTFVVGGLPLARDTVVGRAGLTFRAGNSDVSLTYEWRRAQAKTRHAIQFSLGFN